MNDLQKKKVINSVKIFIILVLTTLFLIGLFTDNPTNSFTTTLHTISRIVVYILLDLAIFCGIVFFILLAVWYWWVDYMMGSLCPPEDYNKMQQLLSAEFDGQLLEPEEQKERIRYMELRVNTISKYHFGRLFLKYEGWV